MEKIYTLILATLTTAASAQNLEWARGMGGTGVDMGHTIAVDLSGNVYATGLFAGTADFDPGPGVFNLTSAGSWDIYIQKMDPSGIFLWAKSIGSTGDDRGQSIATDGASVYLTGMFAATVDFNPGAGTFNMTSAGVVDAFVMKLDAAGNFAWATRLGGSGDDRGLSIALDLSSNVYTTGHFMNNANGSANLNSAGQEDIFVQKVTAAGNTVWTKRMGSNGIDIGNGITVSNSGNVYSTGTFQVTVDFNPGGGNVNFTCTGGPYWDIYIQKLDANGNFVWARQMGSEWEDRGYAITTDAAENVYSTGFFYDTCDFDPGPGVFNMISLSSRDVYIQKLDVSGNFVWAKRVGGMFDMGHSIDVDVMSNVYTTGFFASTGDFDPGPGVYNMTASGQDIFLLKLDVSGNFVWALQFGGTGGDGGYATTTAVNGSVYAAGYFWQTIDFDPGPGTFNLTSAGATDVYILKLNEIPSPLPVELIMFDAIPIENKRVRLNWVTASEINNDYFTVERSKDVFHWEAVTQVDGSGISNTSINYEAWDDDPYVGTSYYRLKQTDFDGRIAYSNIVKVNLTTPNNIVFVSPNPAMNFLTISSGETNIDQVEIYDAIGKHCLSAKIIKDMPSHVIDVSGLSQGIYFINLTNGTGNIISQKIVKM